MISLRLLLLNVLLLLTVPLTSMASDGHTHARDHHANGQDHQEMTTDGSMAILGSMSSKGVKAMAHIKDVSETMAKMGFATTHHFMIAFVDEATGEQIVNGNVVLKVINPDSKTSETVELVGMDGHFGADIVLNMEGEYHFRLGTKLEDGTKRQFHFHYVN